MVCHSIPGCAAAALQGLTPQEASESRPAAFSALMAGRDDPSRQIPGGGESPEQLRARLAVGVEEIAARHRGKKPAAGIVTCEFVVSYATQAFLCRA